MGKQSKHMKHKQIYLIDLKKEVQEAAAAKCQNNGLFVRTLPRPNICRPVLPKYCPTKYCPPVPTPHKTCRFFCHAVQEEATTKVLNAYTKKYDVSMKSPLQ